MPSNRNQSHLHYQASEQPSASAAAESKFYGQYVTDSSSDEGDEDFELDSLGTNSANTIDDADDDDDLAYDDEPATQPPPLKKRKFDDPPPSSAPTSIGYVVQPPSKRPATKMDALREELGLAMALYHLNVDKLSEVASVPRQIFVQWLQGAIAQNKGSKASAQGQHQNDA